MKDTKNIERVRVGTVIDDDGVILQELYSGDKIITLKQTEYKDKYETNFKKKEAFVKVFVNPIVELYKELSTKEYAVTMAFIPFISYKDGILRCDGKIADGKDICEALDDNYDTFKRIITSLVKKDVIKRIERPSDTYQNKTKKCLVVNPFIFLRGTDIEKDIVAEFQNTKWAMIEYDN